MPVISELASTYRGKVSFVAIAGKSDMNRTAEVADSLLNRNVKWGLDESIWDLYGVRGQPVTVIIDRGVIVGQLFGESGIETLTARINELI
ncbi:MAG: TlpA family protein disulfide reductase [Acidimicrobiia bacterium]